MTYDNFLFDHGAKIKTDPGTGCHVWTGAHSGPYPVLKHEGKKVYAHRHVAKLVHGDPDTGMEASHLCHRPSCVNPAHLKWETRAENLGRQNLRSMSGGYRKQGNLWYARAKCRGKRFTSPGFSTETEARAAYEEMVSACQA